MIMRIKTKKKNLIVIRKKKGLIITIKIIKIIKIIRIIMIMI